MGNNLCATWQKGYRDGCDWPPRKDAHLIRLWAEIFEVREENNEVLWGRVSDDVVPVNVVCIQDSPETIYQITAYNRLVEKIFDVYLTQPGTRIIQASDCFVHWRDTKCDREWGLNFTVPLDARRFRECCMSHVCHGLARKALSSESVKVSHLKKAPNVKVGSNQTSPLTQTRCSATRQLDSSDGKCLLGTSHGHHQSDLQQHCSGIHTVAAAPHNGQQVQVRQVLSVYVDNRCRCGTDRHPMAQAPDRNEAPSQHRPQSFPVGTGLYGPCPELGTALYNSHMESQELQCCRCHCLTQTQNSHAANAMRNYVCHYGQIGRHCHVADDNAINQSIYMSAKEARAQQQQLLLEKSLLLGSGSDGVVDMTTKDAAAEAIQQKDSQLLHKEMEPVGDNIAQRQGLGVPNWTPKAPSSSTSTSLIVDSSELPASFDSVTLKRMLRSLSESPPIECTGMEARTSARSEASLESKRSFTQKTECKGHSSMPVAGILPKNTSEQGTNAELNIPDAVGVQTSKDQNDALVVSSNHTSCIPVEAINLSVKDKNEKFDKSNGTRVKISTDISKEANVAVNNCCIKNGAQQEAICDMTETVSNGANPVLKKGEGPTTNSTCSDPVLSECSQSPADVAANSLATMNEKDAKSNDEEVSKEVMNSDTNVVVAQHQRTDSGSWTDTPEVRRLTMSDLSGSECGSDAEGTSDSSSIYTVSMQVAFISPSTAVRKLGWLMVKNWLVHRKRSVELASKRTWNKYWVCLQGNVLLFHACDDGDEMVNERPPKYKLVLEGGLAQAVPEHPKKENIFSLSTAFGDAYLLQTTDRSELSKWINAVHMACPSSIFRQHGKENILRLLQNEIHRMESSIDLDLKMKKMATMHLMTVSDTQSRHAIDKQITQWEESLEKLYVEHYRLRCYIASLKNTDPPNPKTLLGYVSKNTKTVLGRVGVFTVNAFHALVCARAPLSTKTSVASSQNTRCLLSTFKADTLAQARGKPSRTFGPRPGAMGRLSGDLVSDHFGGQDELSQCSPPPSKTLSPLAKSLVRVRIANTQTIVTVEVNERTTVQDMMEYICTKQGFNITDHFLQLKLPNTNSIKIPDKSVLLCSEEFDLIELCAKLLFQIELVRSGRDRDFGFRVEAQLNDSVEQSDNLQIFISEIIRCGMAYRKGIVVGDEILVINGQLVSKLDMVFIEMLLQDLQTICLTVRSCRIDHPNVGHSISTSEPSESFNDGAAAVVTSPSSASQAPPSQGDRPIPDQASSSTHCALSERSTEIPDLLRTKKMRNGADLTMQHMDSSQKVTPPLSHICRHQYGMKPDHMGGNECQLGSASNRPLSNSQRICKVILELIDTERLYVRDLMCLIERYLEPLKKETYLSCDDINQLFGNIQEIVQFQKLFLHSLEEAVDADPNFNMFQEQDKFKDEDLRHVLVLICTSFLYYAHHFKLYSSFCASHSKAQKMILSDDNVALQEFLKSRNPKQQHSATLESYLIKPIQRIVKYPLLLKQLYELTDPHSEEHFHLREALHGMEAVAEHINEMQKIYEEYGSIFEELMRHHKQGLLCNKSIDLNVGELQMYGTVNWINAVEELGKLKKSTDLLTLVFIFKSAIVLLAQERQKFKKKTKATTGRPAWGCESSESTRFKLAIPVDQLQVRTVVGDANDRHGIWEIVHCHSEKEGRPKKVYQFISSHKARNDFIRTIHHTMHESVRRVSVATLKSQANRMQQSVLRQQQQQQYQQQHQSQHQHHCSVDVDNMSSRDTNSNLADHIARLDLGAGQPVDLKDSNAGAGGSSSPIRRGAETHQAVETRDRSTTAGAMAGMCTSPSHRSRHLRDISAPPNENTPLSPRQANGK